MRNNDALSYNFELENRSVCWLWGGLDLQYTSYERPENTSLLSPTYESIFIVGPKIRYNFVGDDCNSYDFIPYIQSRLNISIVENTDELTKPNLGANFGAGLAYSFNAFSSCWMIDLSVDWGSPNNLLLPEGRLPMHYYDIGLNLSWRLQ